MKYLLLIYAALDKEPAPDTKAYSDMMGEYHALTDKMHTAGAFVGAEAIESTQSSKVVRLIDDEQVVMDGPFVETKEQLVGYYIVTCDNVSEACDFAAQIPSIYYGRVDVHLIGE